MKRKVSMLQAGDVITVYPPAVASEQVKRFAVVLNVRPRSSRTRGLGNDRIFNIAYFLIGSDQIPSGVHDIIKAGFVEFELFAGQTSASQDAL